MQCLPPPRGGPFGISESVTWLVTCQSRPRRALPVVTIAPFTTASKVRPVDRVWRVIILSGNGAWLRSFPSRDPAFSRRCTGRRCQMAMAGERGFEPRTAA